MDDVQQLTGTIADLARTIGVGIVSADIMDARVIFGALMGGINGALVAWVRIPSIVVTLATMVALRDGLCHLAGSHLLDPATGEYTLPYLDRLLGERAVAVVRLAHRDQGLIVSPGNPLGLTDTRDLTRAGVRYVNRQRGAGTRVLLDHQLRLQGLSADAVDGYEREEHTHLAVAAAVAAGRADAGLGIMAAARAFGLDFVPVTREPYDLVVTADALDSPLLAPLWALLHSDRFRAEVEDLGGYATAEMGQRIR